LAVAALGFSNSFVVLSLAPATCRASRRMARFRSFVTEFLNRDPERDPDNLFHVIQNVNPATD
jgi:hypothetical protein